MKKTASLVYFLSCVLVFIPALISIVTVHLIDGFNFSFTSDLLTSIYSMKLLISYIFFSLSICGLIFQKRIVERVFNLGIEDKKDRILMIIGLFAIIYGISNFIQVNIGYSSADLGIIFDMSRKGEFEFGIEVNVMSVLAILIGLGLLRDPERVIKIVKKREET